MSGESSSAVGRPRRSARLRGKAGLCDENSGPQALTAPSAEPSPKRRKVNTARSPPKKNVLKEKGKRTCRRTLSMLPDMPLDILFEIFGHLHPLDILHLARTTKALRNVLMQRSAVSIWKQARKQIEDLPDCPPDLSEPQYARLLFDPHCHFCLTARVMTVLWACRARCCKSCMSEHVTESSSLYNLMSDFKKLPISKMVPMEFRNKPIFLKRDALALREQITAVGDDKEKLEEFGKTKVEEVQAIETHARAVAAWQDEQAERRGFELETIRYNRMRSIMSKLSELGYQVDLEKMSEDFKVEFEDHPLVKQPKELTARIWNNIREPMLAYMERVRADRLARERCQHMCLRIIFVKQLLDIFSLVCPPRTYLPSTADFCVMPEFKRSLMVPPEEPPPRGELLDAFACILELCARWRGETSARLLPLLPPPPGSAPGAAPLSRLGLATTFFRCKRCPAGWNAIGYPRVLAHECLTVRAAIDTGAATPEAHLHNALALTVGEQPWNRAGDRVAWHEEAHHAARRIVRAVGADPERATWEELDALDARVVCTACMHGDCVRVMTWRTAVKHALRSHSGAAAPKAKWVKLNEGDTEQVQDEEAEVVEAELEILGDWACMRCRSQRMKYDELMVHLIDDHTIDNPEEDEDYTLHLDSSTGPGEPMLEQHMPVSELTTPKVRRAAGLLPL
ncbi:hypothetical protein OBBRIDRAFT_781679 [Obba rivulosa]|uniref:F-box domain-containing protein n=1 Tax=Obba rivulosa TaxID=1052685 RepID=A0A8E2ASN3_9APHY|nr:hypothetical protein OBBRIDRAFT_781679 [Obba rivulosa]